MLMLAVENTNRPHGVVAGVGVEGWRVMRPPAVTEKKAREICCKTNILNEK